MTEYTRPATWDDLMGLARALQATGANYALIGGYAVAAHGYNRFSEDVDLLVDPSLENTPKWVAALATLPDRAAKELECDPESFEREGHHAIRINDEFTVDVMPAACGHSWRELSRCVIRIDLGEGVSMVQSAATAGLGTEASPTASVCVGDRAGARIRLWQTGAPCRTRGLLPRQSRLSA